MDAVYVRVGMHLHMHGGVQKRWRQTQMERGALQYSTVSRILITYEYEYKSSLFCMPEHVLITAEACV